MNKKILAITSLYIVVQACIVVGFPKASRPFDLPSTTPIDSTKEKESEKLLPVGNDEATAEAAENSKNFPPEGSLHPLPQDKIEALAHNFQNGLSPSITLPAPPLTPAQTPAQKLADSNKPDYTQLINLMAAYAQNPDILPNILKNIPNKGEFIGSIFAWLGPTAKIVQNTVDGLANIHMKNQQPRLELMRSLSEPAAILSRAALAPSGLSNQVDTLRSATMKSSSDNFDKTVQFSKEVADPVPKGINRLDTQPNGFLKMSPLNF